VHERQKPPKEKCQRKKQQYGIGDVFSYCYGFEIDEKLSERTEKLHGDAVCYEASRSSSSSESCSGLCVMFFSGHASMKRLSASASLKISVSPDTERCNWIFRTFPFESLSQISFMTKVSRQSIA